MSWWRAYDEAVDDPKLIGLTDEQHRFWFNILCIFSAFGGRLPDVSSLKIKLRMQERKVKRLLSELIAIGLLDDNNGLISPHNWSSRQYKSDNSTPRVKRFREAKRNVTETPPETETETETETEREEEKRALARNDVSRGTVDSPKRLSSGYAFDGEIIHLTQKHFDQWKLAYSALDLCAELIARDAWLAKASPSDRKNWFISTSKYLANRNMEARAKMKTFKWASGVEGVY